MWFIRGTDGLTNRERKKLAAKYRAEMNKPLTEVQKESLMQLMRRHTKENND